MSNNYHKIIAQRIIVKKDLHEIGNWTLLELPVFVQDISSYRKSIMKDYSDRLGCVCEVDFIIKN